MSKPDKKFIEGGCNRPMMCIAPAGPPGSSWAPLCVPWTCLAFFCASTVTRPIRCFLQVARLHACSCHSPPKAFCRYRPLSRHARAHFPSARTTLISSPEAGLGLGAHPRARPLGPRWNIPGCCSVGREACRWTNPGPFGAIHVGHETHPEAAFLTRPGNEPAKMQGKQKPLIRLKGWGRTTEEARRGKGDRGRDNGREKEREGQRDR